MRPGRIDTHHHLKLGLVAEDFAAIERGNTLRLMPSLEE